MPPLVHHGTSMGLYAMYLAARSTRAATTTCQAMQATTGTGMHTSVPIVARTTQGCVARNETFNSKAQSCVSRVQLSTKIPLRAPLSSRSPTPPRKAANLQNPTPNCLAIPGGYVLIPGRAILGAWWRYKAGLIEFRTLKVYLASFEVLARRQGHSSLCHQTSRSDRLSTPSFTTSEFASLLVGSPPTKGQGRVGERVNQHEDTTGPRVDSTRRSQSVTSHLNTLVEQGMLEWTSTRLRHPPTTAWTNTPVPEDSIELFGQGNMARLIPIPRRLLRSMLTTTSPAILATALAHCIRCLYNKGTRQQGRGLVKCSWIAQTFGLHERTIKHARATLSAQGWFTLESTPQHVMNRWGECHSL